MKVMESECRVGGMWWSKGGGERRGMMRGRGLGEEVWWGVEKRRVWVGWWVEGVVWGDVLG